jgi:hypothetical protein
MPFNPQRKVYKVRSLLNHCTDIEDQFEDDESPTIADAEDITTEITFEIEELQGALDVCSNDRLQEDLQAEIDALRTRRSRISSAQSKLLTHFEADREISAVKSSLHQERRRLEGYQQHQRMTSTA